MIRVTFSPPNTPAWAKFLAAATAEHQELEKVVRLGRKPVFKESLYKRGRKELFAAFNGKCAYCEADTKLTQKIAVEHYRPKARVTDFDDTPIAKHPGYYWLAYHWENLLPTCNNCNTLGKHPLHVGQYVGKGTRFPVKKKHARKPKDKLGAEGALLLHPFRDDPRKHLRIDALGRLSPLSPRGDMTIKLLDLNREGLPEARRRTRIAIQASLAGFADPKRRPRGQQAKDQLFLIAEALNGKAPFTFAAQFGAKPYRETLKGLALPTV